MKYPRVSVIIPNYNKAPYLKKRITSILQQTYQNFEIICIDDASTDNSREIFNEFTDIERFTKFLYRETNGGIFTAWNTGIRKAHGEYIWIAESDDYADKYLLETLVKILDRNPNVGLAYCDSWIVDEQDAILSIYDKYWITCEAQARWKRDFINDGKHECRHYLFYKNTIPNASAVLVRRSLYEKVGGAPDDMKLNGDWLLWLKILSISDIAFVAKPLNYFRTHATTMRNVHTLTGRNIEESFRILHYIAQESNISDGILLDLLNRSVIAWVSAALSYSIPFTRHKIIYKIARDIDRRIAVLLLKTIPKVFFEKNLYPLIAKVRVMLKLRTRLKKFFRT